MNSTIQTVTVRIEDSRAQNRTDSLAVEEPMEIRVNGHSIAVTMRTPGHDFELAAGFLYTEGVITRRSDVRQIRYCARSKSNVVRVDLAGTAKFDPDKLSRHVFTTSSCGVCGKATLDQVRAALPRAVRSAGAMPAAKVLCAMPNQLRSHQAGFARTGGLHATAVFDSDGNLLLIREDVGRHNAMDKAVGALFLAERLPIDDTVALVSGRASFELVQKAAMAGIPTLAAVGAPSNLAVELARDCGMRLIGFLRNDRFNVYTG